MTHVHADECILMDEYWVIESKRVEFCLTSFVSRPQVKSSTRTSSTCTASAMRGKRKNCDSLCSNTSTATVYTRFRDWYLSRCNCLACSRPPTCQHQLQQGRHRQRDGMSWDGGLLRWPHRQALLSPAGRVLLVRSHIRAPQTEFGHPAGGKSVSRFWGFFFPSFWHCLNCQAHYLLHEWVDIF